MVVALDYDEVGFTMTYLLDKIPNEETFATIEVLGDYLSWAEKILEKYK